MKSSVFRDITPHSSVKVNWRFGVIYRLHLHDWKVRYAELSASCLIHAGFSLSLTTLRLKAICFLKPSLTITDLHGVMCQKTELVNYVLIFSLINDAIGNFDYILSLVRGPVTNNNGFWIGWLDLLTRLLQSLLIIINYSAIANVPTSQIIRTCYPFSGNGFIIGIIPSNLKSSCQFFSRTQPSSQM
jgi:hypothetical protein